MFKALLREGLAALSLDWLLAQPCPLCHRLPPIGAEVSPGGLCSRCSATLALPAEGISGSWPLNWWSSGLYDGDLRQTLLTLKKRPNPALLRALLLPLSTALAALELPRGERSPLLVTVPSWKRHGNPLPGLIAEVLGRELGLRQRRLLERSRVVLGQHRLGRRLRLANQRDSFRCLEPPPHRAARPVLIVDDILTTGATAGYAALCLERQGWSVLGLACLARTPAHRDGARRS